MWVGATVVVVLAVIAIGFFLFGHHNTPPTYGGGGGGTPGSTTTSTIAPTTTTTILTSGPTGPRGISTVGSVEWTAAQWVSNYYSLFYKWPNVLYGENVLAAKYETPAFAAYNTKNNVSTGVGSQNEWTLLKDNKSGIYTNVTSSNVPSGAGTCAIHCVVVVNWTYGNLNSSGAQLPPAPNAATSGVSVMLTRTGSKWLVSAPAISVAN